MIIKRILTNNAVVIEENNKEKIVCGKGIAFNKRRGMEIDESLVTQIFTLEEDNGLRYETLVKDVPMEYQMAAGDIIRYARSELGDNLPDTLILTLADHIYAAVIRIKDGLEIHNSLLWEIQNFYDVEYRIGLKGLEVIRDAVGITLPEDEAGFIALHIVNAQINDNQMNNAYRVMKVIQEITTIVRYYFSIDFKSTDIYYQRFLTHLKFFALRLLKGKQYREEGESELLNILKPKFSLAYDCSMRIGGFLKEKYNYELSNEEIMYLTIHIHRVVTKSNDQQ